MLVPSEVVLDVSTGATHLELDGNDLTETREVKIRLPIPQLMRLYYLKITAGMNYSDVIRDALEMYLKAGESGGSDEGSKKAPARRRMI